MTQQLESAIPALRRFAYSLTGNPDDADDLVQSTCERILAKGIPDGVETLKWAFKVCRNLWIDEFRSRKVRQSSASKAELADEQIFDGQTQIYAEITLDEVNRAMESLNDDQRAILSQVAIQGLSYAEVAESLGVPTGTVMSRLARARAKLADRWNKPQLRLVK